MGILCLMARPCHPPKSSKKGARKTRNAKLQIDTMALCLAARPCRLSVPSMHVGFRHGGPMPSSMTVPLLISSKSSILFFFLFLLYSSSLLSLSKHATIPLLSPHSLLKTHPKLLILISNPQTPLIIFYFPLKFPSFLPNFTPTLTTFSL